MAVTLDAKKMKFQTRLLNSPKQIPVTSVMSELDYFNPRYQLRDLVSSDKGEDKER